MKRLLLLISLVIMLGSASSFAASCPFLRNGMIYECTAIGGEGYDEESFHGVMALSSVGNDDVILVRGYGDDENIMIEITLTQPFTKDYTDNGTLCYYSMDSNGHVLLIGEMIGGEYGMFFDYQGNDIHIIYDREPISSLE